MKIIHCSDLHLDSKMETNLTREQAKLRQEELLESYERMVAYAAEHEVRLILIAGDMFDRRRLHRKVRNRVLESMQGHPQIDFLYLRGNHDDADFLLELEEEEIPSNLKTFDHQGWRSYDYGELTVTGAELSKENVASLPTRLVLDAARTNIVMLHGQTQDYLGKDPAEEIILPDYRGKGIDYMALGHIHSFRLEKLDERGSYCYSGCLEGRGFDECGPKGFVLLTLEGGRFSPEFIPFASRLLHEIPLELDPDDGMAQLLAKSDAALETIPDKDLVKLILRGHVSMDFDLDEERICRRYASRFFCFKLSDQTRTQIDYEAYLQDPTIKGEFVRLMQNEDLEESMKERVIRAGINALTGEELEE